MSTNTDVTFNTSSVGVEEPTLITATTAVDVTPQVQESIVEGHKKEYSIVGDGLYASVNAAEAPTWLTSLIDSTVSTAVAGGMVDYDLLVQDVRSAVDSIDVAKNTYVTQISVTPLVDGIVTTRLDTLNATYGNTYATKVELTTAVATSDAAMLQNISNLEASLNGSIDAKITNVQTALTTKTSVLASDIAALEASYVDQESGLSAAATAVSGLQTYVGLNPDSTTSGTGLIGSVQSLSTSYTNLENQVTGVDGYVNTSLSNLALSSAAYTDAVENKFAYNSAIRLASGNYYTAGFGLKAVGTTGTGTELDPYNSEFWINAEKFKFTNTNQTGQAAPFTIDASGVTPKIGMTGDVVIDGSVTGITNLDAGSITTGQLTAVNIDATNLLVSQARSDNFVAGVSGWSIEKDGSAEFNTTTFRGTIDFKDVKLNGLPVSQFIPLSPVTVSNTAYTTDYNTVYTGSDGPAVTDNVIDAFSFTVTEGSETSRLNVLGQLDLTFAIYWYGHNVVESDYYGPYVASTASYSCKWSVYVEYESSPGVYTEVSSYTLSSNSTGPVGWVTNTVYYTAPINGTVGLGEFTGSKTVNMRVRLVTTLEYYGGYANTSYYAQSRVSSSTRKVDGYLNRI